MEPVLAEKGVRFVAVGIGTVERAREFCLHVGFPSERLLADPENKAYDALGLFKGVTTTFFEPTTPFAILDRFQKDEAGDLLQALGRWKPWIPPKLEQGLQQGGVFVFKGSEMVYSHYDPSTGAHADLGTVLAAACSAVEDNGSEVQAR